MLKVCTAFHRKPGQSFEEYRAYWSGEHPAFVKRLPGLLGYTQNRPLKESFELEPLPPYDGLVELWFADSGALKAMSASQEFADLCEDEHNFADRSTLKIVFTTEHIVRDGSRAPSDVKRITFLKRGEGVAPEAFQDRIIEQANAPDAIADAKILVVSLPRLNGYAEGREPAWDGYEMAWFSDFEQARAAPGLNAGPSEAHSLFCREVIVVQPN